MNKKIPLEATESDRNLSSALIGGAFGFIGIAIFASASYADKVDAVALWWGNVAATVSVGFLLASIISGGWGWTKRCLPGPLNPFSLQALFGLIGVVLLGVSAGYFAFNPKEDVSASGNDNFSKRIEAIELEQARQGERLNALTRSLTSPDNGNSIIKKIE